MKKMNGIKVLVTGAGGPAGMGVIKSLKLSDLDINILGADMDKYAPGLYISDKSFIIPAADNEKFSEKILEICDLEDVDIIIPTVDQEVVIFSKFMDRLNKIHVKIMIPNLQNILNCINKWKTYNICKKERLDVPLSIQVTRENIIENMSELDFPIVIRPYQSRGARGISFIQSKDEIPAAIRKAEKYSDKYMIQEFVPGPVYTVSCLLDQKSNIKASIVLKKLKEKPSTGGVAIAGKTIVNEEIRELGEKYAKALNWVGICSPEIKFDINENKYKLMEINPRIFGYNYLASVAGVNLSELYINLCLGKDIEKNLDYKENLFFIRSWNDIVVKDIK
ncbi:MAG: ATP-grasp domain-containing protein [Candidatus Lokiarchaeota archaeon]|nr:ATP-grasp domain-containing protein [Candidatus Lokiarchaeota archaeon]